ncbi:MAG: pyridoxine 4-dehydrogenase [Frankiales bacterium]|nr:pyridoxine 4-dehydrogenase [Frankiales bacterium]
MTLAGTAALGPHTVHRMGYGAMQLAGPGVFGPPKDRDEALRVLAAVREAGIDHIDTSQYYGPDVVNELLREALHPYDGITLVSKVGARRDDEGAWIPWNQPDDLRQGIEDNLRSLGVERLGAVNLRVMPQDPMNLFEKQLTAMVQARDEGLIDAVGISNVSKDQFALAADEIGCVQNPYNLVDRSSQPVLDACTERGIAFVPFFPLGSGFGVNDVRGHPAVVQTSKRLGATPSQVALAWTLAQSPVVLLIPGTSSTTHLAENLAAAEISLDEEALALLS